jgi:hypothetical protein
MWSPKAGFFAAAVAIPGEALRGRPSPMREVNMQDLVHAPGYAEAPCGKARLRAWAIRGGIALGACIGSMSGAPAGQPEATLSKAADEAVGRPGVDPYAFHVFNRQESTGARPSTLPPAVCLCFEEPLRHAAKPPPAVAAPSRTP